MKLILTSPTTLWFDGKEYRCATGAGGIKKDKTEGDQATPVGVFGLTVVFHRPDKLPPPKTILPCYALTPQDGWCDDPTDRGYNTPVRLPYKARCEELWRTDEVYDLIVTTTYNTNPVVPYKGSAIFLHLARENYSPTAGCIAVNQSDLLEILKNLTPETQLVVPEEKVGSTLLGINPPLQLS
jgi:L,D-peptidoglycan transpeptidase YkuD (ErfK/YbiS/YcfS/YnhG family)